MATTSAGPPIPRGLRRRARINLVLTAIVLSFEVVGFHTNWLLPKPRFCGSILADGSFKEDAQAGPGRRESAQEQRVCVREIIHPFSRFSGSATVALSVQGKGRGMKLYDIQFFIARRLGPHQHNDVAGDWIFINETSYNESGWRLEIGRAHV